MHSSGSRIVVTATIIYTTNSTPTTHNATSIFTIASDSSNARTAIITANDSANRHADVEFARQLDVSLDSSLDSWVCHLTAALASNVQVSAALLGNV